MKTEDFAYRLIIPGKNKLLAQSKILQDKGVIHINFGKLNKGVEVKIPIILNIGSNFDEEYNFAIKLTAKATGTSTWRQCTVEVENHNALPSETTDTKPFSMSIVATGKKLKVGRKKLTIHVPPNNRAQMKLVGIGRTFEADENFQFELQCRHVPLPDKLRHFLEWQYQLAYGPNAFSFDIKEKKYFFKEQWRGPKPKKSYPISTAGFRKDKLSVCVSLVDQFLRYWLNCWDQHKRGSSDMSAVVAKYDHHLLKGPTGTERDKTSHEFMQYLHKLDKHGKSKDGDIYYCSIKGHSWLVIKLAGDYRVPKKYIYGWGPNADIAIAKNDSEDEELLRYLNKVIDYSDSSVARHKLLELAKKCSIPSWYEKPCEPGWYIIQASSPFYPLPYVFSKRIPPKQYEKEFIVNKKGKLRVRKLIAKTLPSPTNQLSEKNRLFGYYFKILDKQILLSKLQKQVDDVEKLIDDKVYPKKDKNVKAFAGTPLVWCNARMELTNGKAKASFQLNDEGEDIWVLYNYSNLAWFKVKNTLNEKTGWLDITKYPESLQDDELLKKLVKNDCRLFG